MLTRSSGFTVKSGLPVVALMLVNAGKPEEIFTNK